MAQNSSLALSNREQAANLAAISDDSNECFTNEDFRLYINFGRTERTLDSCSVVPVEALLSYPEVPASGSAEVCINFPLESFRGQFSLENIGDFTSSEITGTFMELCRTITYPNLNAEGDDIGFVRSRFFVIPTLAQPDNAPIVQDISGSVETDEVSYFCNESISFGFTPLNNFAGDNILTVAPDGVDLSDLLAQNCTAGCFPAANDASPQGDVVLFGELNVDIDYTFGQQNNPFPSTLVLGPASKINVTKGSTLTLKNVEISGCFEMWDAITVEADATLIIEPGVGVTPPFTSVRPSIVSDGLNGIVVHKGGNLITDNVTFEENYVGVTTLNDGENKSANINIFGTGFTFGEGETGEQVDVQPFLLPPHFGGLPRAGIEVFDLKDGLTVDFGIEKKDPSHFENLENGIILDASAGYVSSATFTNLRTTNNQESGNGILIKQESTGSNRDVVYVRADEEDDNSRVSFSHSDFGIRALNAYRLWVRNAEFADVQHGVWSDNPSRLRIYNNEFDTWRSGVSSFRRRPGDTFIRDNKFIARQLTPGGGEGNAIRLGSVAQFFSERARIERNEITLAGAASGVYVSNMAFLYLWDNNVDWSADATLGKGVLIEGKTSGVISGNYLIGNETDNFTGFEFNTVGGMTLNCNRVEDINLGMHFIGNNGNFRIRGNVMENAGTGLRVGVNPDDGVFNTIGIQRHTGNRWLGNFGVTAADYAGGDFDLPFSRFDVDDDAPGFVPQSWLPLSSSFVRLELNSPFPFYTCPSGLPPGDNFTGNDGYIRSLLDGSIDWSSKRPASATIAATYALSDMRRGIIASNELNSWSNRPELVQIKEVLDARSIVADVFSPPSTDELAEEAYAEDLESAYLDYTQASIAGRRSAFSGGTFPTATVTSAHDNLTAIRQNGILTLVDPANGIDQRISSAASQITTIVETDIHFENERLVDGFILQLAKGGLPSLEVHRNVILSVAEQCPAEGGEAVFVARTLAAMLGVDQVYDAAESCGSDIREARSASLKTSQSLVKVFPNPVRGLVTVESTTSGIASVNLTDISGRIVYDFHSKPHEIKPESFKHGINTEQHAPGLYTLSVRLIDGSTVSKKVVVLK